jgi:hypothetical protein
MRRFAIIVLWAWLAIGTLVFMGNNCTKDDEGAMPRAAMGATTSVVAASHGPDGRAHR